MSSAYIHLTLVDPVAVCLHIVQLPHHVCLEDNSSRYCSIFEIEILCEGGIIQCDAVLAPN